MKAHDRGGVCHKGVGLEFKRDQRYVCGTAGVKCGISRGEGVVESSSECTYCMPGGRDFEVKNTEVRNLIFSFQQGMGVPNGG